jgi:hypothetical protein
VLTNSKPFPQWFDGFLKSLIQRPETPKLAKHVTDYLINGGFQPTNLINDGIPTDLDSLFLTPSMKIKNRPGQLLDDEIFTPKARKLLGSLFTVEATITEKVEKVKHEFFGEDGKRNPLWEPSEDSEPEPDSYEFLDSIISEFSAITTAPNIRSALTQKSDPSQGIKPLFFLDLCFNDADLHMLLMHHKPIFVWSQPPTCELENIFTYLTLIHHFPYMKIVFMRPDRDFFGPKEILPSENSHFLLTREELADPKLKIVATKPGSFPDECFRFFGFPDNHQKVFNWKRNLFFHSSYMLVAVEGEGKGGDRVLAGAKGVDTVRGDGNGIFNEICSLRLLLDKATLLDFVYEDPQKRLKELIKVSYSFGLEKIKWAVSEKNILADNFPFCYSYYNVYQKRSQEAIAEKSDFFIHNYVEFDTIASEESQAFMEFWTESTFSTKSLSDGPAPKKIRFIDSLENAALVNDSVWFTEQFSTAFLGSETWGADLQAHFDKTGMAEIPKIQSREFVALDGVTSPAEVQDRIQALKLQTPIIAVRLAPESMRRWVIENPEKVAETLSVSFIYF